MRKRRAVVVAAILFVFCMPLAAEALDNVFEITHRRFEPLRGESAQIRIVLPQGGFTTVKVYNLRGEQVVILLNEYSTAGQHYTLSWGGLNAAGELVASGTYVIQITAATFTQTRKVVMVK